MAGVEQFLDADRSDISRSACDKYFHAAEANALSAAAQREKLMNDSPKE